MLVDLVVSKRRKITSVKKEMGLRVMPFDLQPEMEMINGCHSKMYT